MLTINSVTANEITLNHIDERSDSPGRYSGLATAEIVTWCAAAFCTRILDSGIAIFEPKVAKKAVDGIVGDDDWRDFVDTTAPFTSAYQLCDQTMWLLPADKEGLDQAVNLIFPSLNAKISIFADRQIVFGPKHSSLDLAAWIAKETVVEIVSGVDTFRIRGAPNLIDLREICREICADINQFLN